MFYKRIKHERLAAKAEAEGEKAIEVAKNLKAIGISPAQISQATGLSLKEIENL